MQTKLTLHVEEAVVRKAKRLAKTRGTSVSRIFGDYIVAQEMEKPTDELPPLTASMLGALRGAKQPADEEDYRRHLEAKHNWAGN
jgi:hypothetical protein